MSETDEMDVEDFMEVVMSFKCKKCDFVTKVTSELAAHARAVHMKKKQAIEPVKVLVEENIVQNQGSSAPEGEEAENDTVEQVEVVEVPEPTEPETPDEVAQKESKNIFLCGECNMSFGYFADCKVHMLEEHNIVVDVSEPEAEPVTRDALDEILQSVAVSEAALEMPADNKKKVAKIVEVKTEAAPPVAPPVTEEAVFVSSAVLVIDKEANAAETEDGKAKEDPKPVKKKEKKFKEFPYRCKDYPGCHGKFRTVLGMNIHTECHNKNVSDGGFKCFACKEPFKQWSLLKYHLWKVHQIEIDLYACEICGHKEQTMHRLEIHLEVHGEQKNYSCDICSKSFKQKKNLRCHRITHVESGTVHEDRWYCKKTCNICGKTVSNKKILEKHMSTVHAGIRPFVCQVCGHATTSKYLLQTHLRQHTGDKPFGCDECNFATRDAKDLRRHKRVHSGHKPYKCDQCSYSTGDHNSLRRHRFRHVNVKPYRCRYCDYSCIQATSYRTHCKSRHDGADPNHYCNICHFVTMSAFALDVHIQDHQLGKAVHVTNQQKPTTTIQSIQLPEDGSLTISDIQNSLGNRDTAELVYSALDALKNHTPSTKPVEHVAHVTTIPSSGGHQIVIQGDEGEVAQEEVTYTVQYEDENSEVENLQIIAATGNGNYVAQDGESYVLVENM